MYWWLKLTKEERKVALEENLAASNLPDSLLHGLVMYFIYGILPGSFLQACLCNDEDGASMRASQNNVPSIPSIFEWLATDAPRDSWGSDGKMKAFAALQKTRT